MKIYGICGMEFQVVKSYRAEADRVDGFVGREEVDVTELCNLEAEGRPGGRYRFRCRKAELSQFMSSGT